MKHIIEEPLQSDWFCNNSIQGFQEIPILLDDFRKDLRTLLEKYNIKSIEPWKGFSEDNRILSDNNHVAVNGFLITAKDSELNK